MYVCVSGGNICSFFGKFGVLSFLGTPVLRFALLPYYRRFKQFDNRPHNIGNKIINKKMQCARYETWNTPKRVETAHFL